MSTNEQPVSKMRDRMRAGFEYVMPQDVQRMYYIELAKITPNPNQPRKTFAKESIEELAQSIGKHGQLMPIVLKKMDSSDHFLLCAGERRYRAHQLLAKTHIYAVITEGDPEEVGLIENIQREDLHPLEEAEGYLRLKERHKYNQDELGQVVGKARNTVNEILRLNTLHEQIKTECRAPDSKVSKSILVQIARAADSEEQLKLWQQIKQRGMTLRATRQVRKTGKKTEKSLSIDQAVATARKLVRQLRGIQREKVLEQHTNQLTDLASIRKDINQQILDLMKSQGRRHDETEEGI